MTNEIMLALIGSVTSLVIAAGGWVWAARQARLTLEIERLERRLDRLISDGRARVALEKVTCEYLGEQQQRPGRAIQLELRALTQQKTGLRPRLTPVDYEKTPIPRLPENPKNPLAKRLDPDST